MGTGFHSQARLIFICKLRTKIRAHVTAHSCVTQPSHSSEQEMPRLSQSFDAGQPSNFSSAEHFPLAAYAPYAQPAYQWNPLGNGLSQRRFDVPIFLVENSSAQAAALQGAESNKQTVRGWKRPAACLPCCFQRRFAIPSGPSSLVRQ